MKKIQKPTLFPETAEYTLEDLLFVFRNNLLKKLTATLLVFLFAFTPLFPAFATTTPITIDDSYSTTSPPSNISETNDNKTIIEADEPTDNSEELSPTPPPPSMLLSGTDPDPRIENAVQNFDSPSVDQSNGALITDYPLIIPPGRNGFQPDLKLQYNSNNSTQIDSPFGAGWNLSIPYIEKINKSGVNNLYSTTTSTPVYFNSSLSGELVASTTAGSTYVSRVDNGEFLNYVFTNNTYWTATDKKGYKYFFGNSESSTTPTSTIEFFQTPLYSDSSLKQYFKLESTSATVGSNLTNNGSTPFNAAKFGNGVDLGTSNSTRYLTNSDNPTSYSFLSGFSTNLWYKPSSTPTGGARWVLGGGFSDSDKVNIRIDYYDDGGTPKVLFIYQKSGVSDTQVAYATTLPTSIFTMVSATYDGSTLRGYVNGASVGSVAVSGSGSGTYGSSGFAVGAAIHGGNKASGVIDDVAALNRELSATEISKIFTGSWPSSTNSTLQDPVLTDHIYKWMLYKITEPNGNEIKYEYTKSGSQVYPSTISYAGNTTTTPLFTVEFTGENRSDISTSTKTGFQVVTSSRIKEINVKKENSLLRKYSLAYSTGDNTTRSLLNSITEIGIDDSGSTTTLPSTRFTYQSRIGGWNDGSYSAPTELQNSVLVDVNGDSYADIVRAYTDVSTTSIITYLNNTQGGWSTSTPYASPTVLYGTGSSCTPLCDKGIRFADVNGDSLVDILSNISTTYLNTGTGWTASSTWASPLPFANGDTNYGNTGYAEIGDVNGDGLPDIFKIWHTDSEEHRTIAYNTGSGFSTSTTWSVPQGVSKLARWNVDLNGDTLTDLIQGFDSTANGDIYDFAAINNGVDSWATTTSFSPPEYFVVDSADRAIRAVDLNGDGLPDLVKNLSGTRDSWLNTSNGWTNLGSSWAPTITLVSSGLGDSSSKLGDLNGDGTTDVLRGIIISGDWHTGSSLNNVTQVDVLTKITYPEGGSTSIAYKPSGKYVDGSNNLLNPSLPFSLNTVYQIVTNDGTATSSHETFTYKGGKYKYNGPFDRKFAGFNEVQKSDALGNVTKTFYHQGDTSATSTGEFSDNYFKIGKPYRVEQYNSSGNLFKKIINEWDSATTTSNGFGGFVKLAQTVDYTYDGDSSHKDKAETYTYNSAGNVTQKVEYGEVTGSDDGTFSDSGTDDFTTTYTYASSSTLPSMSLLASESTVNNGSTKVKESKYYYDTLSAGSIGKGNLTKREDWKTSSTYVDIERTYNSYGLVATEKDPRDKTTTYSYDSLNLYPTTVTNPLSQVTQYVYDYSSGKVATTTDPNANVFVSVYDGLDRVIEQKQPNPDATSTLLTALTFTYTNATSSFSVKKSVHLNNSTTTDSYIYFDGLGRKKQERKEAEGSNYSVKDYVYNNIGSLQKESLPYFSLGFASTTETAVDALFVNYGYDALYRVSTTTNAVGTTTNTYADWKTTITDPNGKLKDLYTDAFGNLKQVDEHNSTSTYTTTYTYDYNHGLTNITDALSNVRNFTYDGLGRRLTAQDLHSSGDGTYGSYSYTYDDSGNLTQKVDPKSQTINYSYDDINRQLTEDYTGTGGTEVTYTYDSCTQGKGRLCTASSSAVSITNTYNALGQLTQEAKVISGNSYTTSYTYDRQGNQLTIVNPDSSEVKYAYNSAGQLETVQRKESTDVGYINVVSDFDYSPTEQVTEIQYANGAITANTYDSTKLYRLQRKVTTIPASESLRGMGPEEEAETLGVAEVIEAGKVDDTPSSSEESLLEAPPEPFSDLEEDTSTTTPEIAIPPDVDTGEEEKTNTTTLPTLPDIEIPTTTPETEASTTLETINPFPEIPVETEATVTPEIIDSEPDIISRIYNAISRGIAKILDNISKSASVVFYSIVKKANAAAVELFNTTLYNDANLREYFRLENTTASVGSNLTNNGSTPFNSAKFNNGADMGSSNTTKWLNNTNNPTGYSFLSGYTLNLWYKPPAAPTGGTRWQIGGAFSDTDKVNLRIDYYDDSGTPKLLYIYQKSGVSDNQVSYATTLPTSLFSMLTLTYNGSSTKAYINSTYLGTISVSGGGSGSFGVSGAAVGAAVHGGNKASGIVDDFAIFNRVLTDQEISDLYNGNIASVGPAIQYVDYTYDNNGNITQIRESASTTLERVVSYSYDDLNRLTSASTTAATSTPYNYSYTYNNIGNMLTRVENGTTTSYTYATGTTAGTMNPHTALKIGTATSTYDNNGNQIATIANNATSTLYTWDYNNRLTQAVGNSATSTSVYDPSGQRVKQTVATTSTTTTYYPTKFYNTNGTTPTKHIFANGVMIATVVGTGSSTTVSYIHTDHLGGSNVMTDDNPDVVELTDYYPYGSSRIDERSGSFNEQRKFTGHEYDTSTGLNYMNARYQNPTTGRFLSQDRMFWSPEKNLSDPQMQNSYSYARNTPLVYVDPDGSEPVKIYTGTVGDLVNLLNNSPNKVGQYKGNDAKNYMLRLDNTQAGSWTQLFRPVPSEASYFNNKAGRYIYTEKGGWIDMAHFMFYAGKAYEYKEAGANDPMGNAVQDGYIQEFADRFVDSWSAYSYEDLPSDRYGADFAVNHFNPNSDMTFSDQVSKYLQGLGATDPKNAPNYQALPQRDSNKKPMYTNHTTKPINLKSNDKK